MQMLKGVFGKYAKIYSIPILSLTKPNIWIEISFFFPEYNSWVKETLEWDYPGMRFPRMEFLGMRYPFLVFDCCHPNIALSFNLKSGYIERNPGETSSWKRLIWFIIYETRDSHIDSSSDWSKQASPREGINIPMKMKFFSKRSLGI